MTAYSFEMSCKRALLKVILNKYGEEFSIEDIHLVSFSKVMRNMKALFIDSAKTRRYYECTLNAETGFIVFTIYEKAHEEGMNLNKVFEITNLNKGEQHA